MLASLPPRHKERCTFMGPGKADGPRLIELKLPWTSMSIATDLFSFTHNNKWCDR